MKKGIYILFLENKVTCEIQVGKLGVYTLPEGYYAYVGTAYGSGGLAARLGRHARSTKKLRWHIDYIREAMRIETAWVSSSERIAEHYVATILAKQSGSETPIKGFGASDCRCPAHLFLLSALPDMQKLNKTMLETGYSVFENGSDYVA